MRTAITARLIAWSMTVAATPAVAAPSSVDPGALEASVSAAQQAHVAAASHLEGLRREQAGLEDQITALKKSGQRGPALERLLGRSIDAVQAFDAAQTELDDAARALEGALRDAIAAIDREITRKKPAMQRGSLTDRRKAAYAIKALRTLRKQFRAEFAALTRSADRRKAWAQYAVKFNAQDGPTELIEKADFVEDTRDKIVRKRRALIRLLAEAQQERELAQAAKDFRTDVTLFDEETRQGRVLRQSRASVASVSADGSDTPTADAPPSLSGDNGGDPSEFEGARDDQGAVPPTSGPPPASLQAAPAALRDINPDVLINLRVDDLAAGALDAATLERYVSDLRALERFLSGQAETLRKRADTLEADETRTLKK